MKTVTKVTKVTKEMLESDIDSVTFNTIPGTTLTHCCIKVKCGFNFTGESACIDPTKFDKEIGEKIAYENAFDKMWSHYGFLMMYNNDAIQY